MFIASFDTACLYHFKKHHNFHCTSATLIISSRIILHGSHSPWKSGIIKERLGRGTGIMSYRHCIVFGVQGISKTLLVNHILQEHCKMQLRKKSFRMLIYFPDRVGRGKRVLRRFLQKQSIANMRRSKKPVMNVQLVVAFRMVQYPMSLKLMLLPTQVLMIFVKSAIK